MDVGDEVAGRGTNVARVRASAAVMAGSPADGCEPTEVVLADVGEHERPLVREIVAGPCRNSSTTASSKSPPSERCRAPTPPSQKSASPHNAQILVSFAMATAPR